jgi:hypothetical protein
LPSVLLIRLVHVPRASVVAVVPDVGTLRSGRGPHRSACRGGGPSGLALLLGTPFTIPSPLRAALSAALRAAGAFFATVTTSTFATASLLLPRRRVPRRPAPAGAFFSRFAVGAGPWSGHGSIFIHRVLLGRVVLALGLRLALEFALSAALPPVHAPALCIEGLAVVSPGVPRLSLPDRVRRNRRRRSRDGLGLAGHAASIAWRRIPARC